MTRIFTAGAEAGTTDVISVVSGVTASTTLKRSGAYSFKFISTANYITEVLTASKTAIYMRIAFYITGLTGANGKWAPLVHFLDSAGNYQFALTANAVTYLLEIHLGDITTTVLASGGLIVRNQWTCIEIRYLIANSGGRFVVKQDGAIIIDYTGDTQSTALTEIDMFRLGHTYSFGFSGYVDDLAVNDTAGAVNNSWIGRGGIYVSVSEEAGTYTDLHASAGNAWDCINEVPPSDADYVYDDTIDQKSTYGLTALVPTTGDIACINVIMRAVQDAAGTANIARLIRSNGVDSQGSDVGLSVSAKTIQENIETDPGQAPGTAWTIAAVNALQAGAVVR